MNKKLLAGLLTVSAFFSLGSTSFASSVETTLAPNAFLPTNVAQSAPNDYVRDLTIAVGETVEFYPYLWHFLRWDGSLLVTEDGRFIGLSPGYSVVAAEITPQGDRLIFKVTVQ
ncbi:hypothetical protein MKY64_14495 [Paenibacillus sp. FSL R7-0210]|uniref:hypothetical protein n=1 Tax=Paenibacillus sp. FSL R7-0210 TaxID=2921676 RepID=UPI0030FA1550